MPILPIERKHSEEYGQLEQSIATLEAQRAVLGDAVVDAALGPMRRRLAELEQAERVSTPRPELHGERKLVTMMFADISGFTALAEQMDPEAVRDLMNACFEQLVPVVENYGGAVDKFIGDEIMALFGAPVAHEDDPVRALRAALDMQAQLATFNAQHATDLGIHFGINTGHVIAGGLGTRERQEYSVMGDAVNLAARLEDLSQRGEILVGPDTHRLTAPLFEYADLAPVVLKGKSEPVPVYRLLAAKLVPGPLRGIAGLESPLVGRQAECAALRCSLERLASGEGGIVTLVGEAGLGKSRLLAEIRTLNLDLTWIEGRCLSYGASLPYLLWLDVLRGLLYLAPEAAPIDAAKALRERVQALCTEQPDYVYACLARLMSLPLTVQEEKALGELAGEQIKTSTFGAIEQLLACAAQQTPLVIVCEDLHWADPTSLELLEHLLRLVENTPLLFICAMRPEKDHGCWRVRTVAAECYSARHTDLCLAPLSAGESQALVGNLLRVEGLPALLKQRILERAEGNPFYVEEIIRSLLDSGAIAHDASANLWRATRDVETIVIPDTLQGVLTARIDRLHTETKHVLQLASVIGRIFFHRVLVAIAQEEQELDAHLMVLQQEEMIRERARVPELEYIFKHQLTQEAAYNGLLKKERRTFHKQVAEALERLFAERIEEQLGLLAYHWERAEEPAEAIEYLSRAGDQARLAYAHAEAIDYYERALVLLKEHGQHDQAARTLMKLGLAYHMALDFQRSRQAYQEGFALWQRADQVRPEISLPPAPHALRMNWPEPVTLDPTLANDVDTSAMIEQLFSGLVELQLDMDIVPDVARSWEVLEGGRKYVFRLREDVRWSDGKPVAARDFEYAWKRVLDPTTGSRSAELLYDVQGARAFHQSQVSTPDGVGVRALDDLTLVVELEAPAGYFLNLLALIPTFPVPQHVVEQHGAAWTDVGNIVSNGPFKLEAWQPGQSIILSRNPNYHGRFGGNVQRIEDCLLTDGAVTLQMYEAGDLDIWSLVLPYAEMDRVRQRHAGYFSGPGPATGYVGFDLSRPPFDDVRVRRALVHATDREMLADVVLRGYESPATGGFVPPGMPGHSPGIGLAYDPERARQLLAQAGYPGGRGFPVMTAWTSSVFAEATKALQAQWRESLGVEMEWELFPRAVFLDKMDKSLPHLFYIMWQADYPDPDNFLRVGLAQRYQQHWNATFDELVERARRSSDQAERMKLYQAADRILIEEAVMMPTTYGRWNLLIKPWVKKHPTSPFRQWFWKDVVIEPH